LQLIGAWRADRSRRAQLPLIISGGISAIAGISFAAMAAQHVAPTAPT
jgi:CHASE2 domain-containing sensor protein